MEKKEKNRNSYSELPEKEVASSTKTVKKDSRKSKENRDIRILKKCKSIKEKNDPERFSGEGINFRAKIIGIEDVFDARGNRMCQGALQKLKAAVKTSGDHKQRIILNISLNGIIIQDEKSGKVLHHHPIHKISCISQDTKDSRAFGFVYGCPQTGHRFFAIKTEKTASQVVVTLRDLFLVALEMKKKEIEKAIDTQKEENGEQESKIEEDACKILSNGNTPATAFFAPSFESRSKSQRINPDLLYSNTVLLPEEVVPEKFEFNHAEEDGAEPESAVEALLDLQSEVNILQQGICQMDQTIAHTVSQSKGFSFSEDEISESSVSSVPTSFQFKLDKLSSLYHETLSISSRSSSTSDYNVCLTENKLEENDTPKKDPLGIPASLASEGCSSDVSSLSVAGNGSVSETSQTNSTAALTVEDRYAVFLDIDSLPSIFDNPSIVKMPEEKEAKFSSIESQNSTQENEVEDSEMQSSTPVPFAELDPLGNQPYVDKRDFFQDIKNPPKKVLKDLVGANVFFGGSDGETVSNSHECLAAFTDLNFNHSESSCNPEGIPPLADPPRLPPKRISAVSPFAIVSENDFSNDDAWEPKNPFNPFLGEEYPDMLPPSSPPPPPPPRLPSKLSESSLCMSPPPPRPPSRVNCVPTPPLPKRKVPLSSAQRTWFSFDQDSTSIPTVPFPVESDYDVIAPPLPSPARKLPPSQPESPLLKSSSASNSPATVRRFHNKSSFLGSNVVIKENSDSDSVENGALAESKDPKLSTRVVTTSSPRRLLTRHTSIMQDEDTSFYNKSPFLGNATMIKEDNSDLGSHSVENGTLCESKDSKPDIIIMGSPRRLLMRHSSIVQNEEACTGATFNPFVDFEESEKLPEESYSPPLPPKPVSICQSKPLSVKKMASNPCVSSFSSSSVSVTESSNGTHSSSSLVFSSSDDNRFGSSSEALFTTSTDSQSEVFAQNSLHSQSSNGTTEDPDLSPDSIFRRKSDPFADDFFLTLHKKSNDNTQSITKKSSTVVEVPFNNLKAPT